MHKRRHHQCLLLFSGRADRTFVPKETAAPPSCTGRFSPIGISVGEVVLEIH